MGGWKSSGLVGVGDADDLVGDEALIAFSAGDLCKDPGIDEFPDVR
jgi:hypothetical protein